MGKRALAVAVAMLMTAGVLEFGLGGGNPVGAAPVSKSVSGTCTGADAASLGLLNTLGGSSLAVDFKIDGDVPKTLDPGQTGATASFTWSVTLDQALVNKAAGFGVKNLAITKTKLNIAVNGPTSTKVVAGSPTDASLALSPNVPAILTRGPFTAPLENVGDSGVINYTISNISFTIGVALAGTAIDVNIVCSAPGLVASSPVKVPGAPEVTQPIEVKGSAGAAVPIDVVGKYTKAGRTALIPGSLRSISGPASVKDGKLVVTAGGAGSATSATFEICGEPIKIADQQAGTNEVQRLTLDPNVDTLKKGIGFSLKVGDNETAPIWTAELGFFGFLGGLQLGTSFPTNWAEVANNYATGTQYLAPSAGTIQAALAALPGIGAGNVVVTKVAGVNRPTYDLAFQGALAEKDVPEIKIGRYLSVFPQENLDALIALAGSLGAGAASGSGTGTESSTTTTIPAGLTIDQYIERLRAEVGDLLAAGDINAAGDKLAQVLQISLTNSLANINVQEVIASINNLFPEKPKVETTTAGAEPIAAQFQDLCAQASATVVVDAAKPVVTTPPQAPAPQVLPNTVNRTPVRKYCYTTKRTYRVRIKGTKRYRRVTRNVRVCSSSSYAKRKAAAQAAAARKAAAKRAAVKRAAAKRAAAKRAATYRR